MPDDKVQAELGVQIDERGNLVVKNLDKQSLERLRAKLDEVNRASAGAEAAGPKLRVEAFVA